MKAGSFWAWLALVLAAAPAEAETTVALAGELSFWAGDDDALAASGDAGETFLGPEPPTALALDELSPRESVRARRLALALGARAPATVFRGSTALEACFAVEHEAESGGLRLRDQGSHLELAREGELVVTKHRFSAFAGTDLDLSLRSRGIQTLVFCGCVTYVCVESTVRDAFFANYHIVVCEDAVAGWHPEWHRHSLEIMHWWFGDVVPSAEVMEAWEKTSITRR